MARSFSTFALSEGQIGLAYPLVSAASPKVGLARWRKYAEDMTAGQRLSGGVLGMRGEGAYLCGVMAYHVEPDLAHDRILAVNLFVALDLIDQESAVGTLLDIAEAKARELRCDAVYIRIGRNHQNLTNLVESAGYVPDALLLHKSVAEPVTTN
jgi:hypothetical protein